MTYFKVGDKVRFKTLGELQVEFAEGRTVGLASIRIPFGINSQMSVYCDKIAIIKKIEVACYNGGGVQKIYVEFKDEELTHSAAGWSFSGEMFALYRPLNPGLTFSSTDTVFPKFVKNKLVKEALE